LGHWIRNKLTGQLAYLGIRKSYNQKDSTSLLYFNANSVCINESTIREIKLRGVEVIFFKVKNGDLFVTTLSRFETEGVRHWFAHKGQKPQLALDVNQFVRKKNFNLKGGL
jgi:hypothetical protein